MSLTYIREYTEDGGIFSEPDSQPGSALTELIDHTRPTVKVALELIAAIGDILAIAEEDGKSHGDPKIGMVRIDSNGNTALEDFRESRRTTRAPEPKPLGPPSDVYGMGVILHSLLSMDSFGRVSKEAGAHDKAIAAKVMSYNLGSAEGQEWTQELKEFMVSMMAHQPSDRPNSDEVAEVLGNAADSLNGETLGEWAKKVVKASAPQASSILKSAPTEDLEGVRTLHKEPTPPADFLDEEPDTDLEIPTIRRMIAEEELGGPVLMALDESLDETVLDGPNFTDDYSSPAQETRIDELPFATAPEDSQSLYDQETVVDRKLIEESKNSERKGQSPAKKRPIAKPVGQIKQASPPKKTRPTTPPPAGVIKGPAIPRPPPLDTSSEPNKAGAKGGLIAAVILVLVGVGAYVSQEKEEAQIVLPGPIENPDTTNNKRAEPDPSEEREDDTAVVAVEEEPPEDIAPVKTTPAPVKAAPVKAAPVKAAPVKAAPKPRPVPKSTPQQVVTPTPAPVAPAPAAAPVAGTPPFRVRLDLRGNQRKITCGDGQSPEVTGQLSLTFDSIQYCRVEIDGGMGILNISDSGTYSCANSGQVICSKTR
jgi:hypothetical protein